MATGSQKMETLVKATMLRRGSKWSAGNGSREAGRRRWPVSRVTAAAAVVAAAVLASGVALASIPDAGTGVFHGCYSKRTGALRLIDPSKGQKCATSEKSVTWNQAGITWKGSWSKTTGYQVHDAVAFQGSSFLAIHASKGANPGSNTADWAVLARGGQGPPGPTLLPSQVTLGVGVPDVLNAGGYGFSAPAGIAFDGTHLWIANVAGNSVTEVNAADGSLVRVLTG